MPYKTHLDLPPDEIGNSTSFFKIEDIGGLFSPAIEIIKKYKIKGVGVDLACGTGLLCIEATKNQILKLNGVDIDKGFIERANKSSKEEGLSCEFYHKDIEDFITLNNYKYNFASSLCCGNAFPTNNHYIILNKIRMVVGSKSKYLYGFISDTKSEDREIEKVIADLGDSLIHKYKKSFVLNEINGTERFKSKYPDSQWFLEKEKQLKSLYNHQYDELIFLIEKN